MTFVAANAGEVLGEGGPFSLTVYGRMQSGDVAPRRQIVGALTGLSEPVAVALGGTERAAAPMVSAWGLAALAAAVFGTGLWILRVRRSGPALAARRPS